MPIAELPILSLPVLIAGLAFLVRRRRPIAQQLVALWLIWLAGLVRLAASFTAEASTLVRNGLYVAACASIVAFVMVNTRHVLQSKRFGLVSGFWIAVLGILFNATAWLANNGMPFDSEAVGARSTATPRPGHPLLSNDSALGWLADRIHVGSSQAWALLSAGDILVLIGATICLLAWPSTPRRERSFASQPAEPMSSYLADPAESRLS